MKNPEHSFLFTVRDGHNEIQVDIMYDLPGDEKDKEAFSYYMKGVFEAWFDSSVDLE